MRDLQVALKGLCLYEHEDDFLYAEHGQDTISFPLTLVKEAIERAIKAEAEVELLRADKNKQIDVILKQEAELTLLRKVAEAAGEFVGCPCEAEVSGNAEVSEPTHIFTCGPIGSRNAITTFYRVRGNKIDVLCGCFRGSIDEFEQAVVREHKGTKHEKAYLAAIKLAKMQIELEVGVDKEGEN